MRAIYLIARREYLSYVATGVSGCRSPPSRSSCLSGRPFLHWCSRPSRCAITSSLTRPAPGWTEPSSASSNVKGASRRAPPEAAAPVSADAQTRERALAAFDADPLGQKA